MTNKVNFSTHAEILRLLGGYAAIAEALTEIMGKTVPYPTVASWKVIGIPSRIWPEFIAIARDHDLAIDANQLLLTRPQRAKTERRARRMRAAGAALRQGAPS